MTDKTIDYIKIKVFLYKYNPIFNTVEDSTNKNASELATIRQQIADKQKQLALAEAQLSPTISAIRPAVNRFMVQWQTIIEPYLTGVQTPGKYSSFKSINIAGGIVFDTELTKTQQGVVFDDVASNWNRIIINYLDFKLNEPADLDSLLTNISKLSNSENVIKIKTVSDKRRAQMWADTYVFIKNTVRPSAGLVQIIDQQAKIALLKVEIAALEKQEFLFLQGLSRVQRFEIDLDEDKYFSKIDISDFVSDYRCTQNLHNEINWSVNLFNGTLDNKNMDKYFLRRGNLLINSPNLATYSTLADYETEDDNFTGNYENEVKTIKVAMDERTDNVTTEVTQQATTEDKSKDITNRQPQVLLSDLIQKFDFISCYIYKSTEPINDDMLDFGVSGKNLATQGIQEEVWMMQNGFSNEFNGFVLSKTVSHQVGSLNTLSISGSGSFCLFDRTKVLYSPTLFTASLYDQAELFDRSQLAIFSSLYSDESITGIINILLRDVYRIIPVTQDPLLKFKDLNNSMKNAVTTIYEDNIQRLKNSLDQVTKAESTGNDGWNGNHLTKVSNYDYVSGKLVYLGDVTDSFYWKNKIATAEQLFQDKYQVSSIYGKNFTIYNSEEFAKLQADLYSVSKTYFFDMTRIKIENGCHTNIFNIPAYLFSLVMKAKSFNYRDATNAEIASAVNTIKNQTSSFKVNLGQSISNYMSSEFPSDNIEFLNSTFYGPVLMELDVNKLKAYFLFLESGFSNFTPTMYTPNQILDEVKAASFIEIFETATGTLVIRPPKYNDKTSILFSSDYNVLSTQYTDSVKGLVSKEKLTYYQDLIKNIPFNVFAFTNGKLLTQYGLTETNASANPNAKYTLAPGSNATVNKSLGIFNYARFFLELNNASQKTSNISAEYVPASTIIKNPNTGEYVQQAFGIGNLFFDEVNNKISYITSIDKSCKVGDVPSMSFTGTYVRDGYRYGDSVEFRQLPELIDLNKLFTT